MRELQRYQDEQILTSPPERLIQLLLLRGVADLSAAEGSSDAEHRRACVRHAQDIVTELRCALDLDAGEIARNLDRLYVFVGEELTRAYCSDDLGAVASAQQVLTEILEGWKTVVVEAPGLRLASVPAT